MSAGNKSWLRANTIIIAGMLNPLPALADSIFRVTNVGKVLVLVLTNQSSSTPKKTSKKSNASRAVSFGVGATIFLFGGKPLEEGGK